MGDAFTITITESCNRCCGLTAEGVCWRNKSPYFGEKIPEPKACYCKVYKDKYYGIRKQRREQHGRKKD